MKNGVITDEYGAQRWYVNQRLHRTDGPAFIRADGTQAWYDNEQLHRTDGPAIIYSDGSQYWFVNGQRHRTDGPAVIWADGSQEWWVNDRHLTKQITTWMTDLDITYPFDEEHQALFLLTFGGK